jgi:hypothetical protein
LTCTQGVTKEYTRQGIRKAIFFGECLFVSKISGISIMWITSFGAIVRKDICLKSLFFSFNWAFYEALSNVLIISSWSKERDVLLAMATLSRGTLKYVLERVASGGITLVSQWEKGWCASSRGLELSSYRLEIQ